MSIDILCDGTLEQNLTITQIGSKLLIVSQCCARRLRRKASSRELPSAECLSCNRKVATPKIYTRDEIPVDICTVTEIRTWVASWLNMKLDDVEVRVE